MQTIKVRTPAKLNLTFEILGARDDGFHDIETLFQSINLEDEIQVNLKKADSDSFSISLTNPALKKLLPLDQNNLLAKASRAFFERLRPYSAYAVDVILDKRIPIAAGLAGGSANAAGMLVALNRAFGDALSPVDIETLASKIGSDVAFCLRGGTCIGRGRGEILEEVDNQLTLTYCVVKPRKLSLATEWAYKSFDTYNGPVDKVDIQAVISGLAEMDIEKTISGFGNVFQEMVFREHPQLRDLQKELLALGAWSCHMTGSGPTLFAVISGRELGHHIRRQVLKDDEIGFVYGSEDILAEALPPIDFRLAESSKQGARIVFEAGEI